MLKELVVDGVIVLEMVEEELEQLRDKFKKNVQVEFCGRVEYKNLCKIKIFFNLIF